MRSLAATMLAYAFADVVKFLQRFEQEKSGRVTGLCGELAG